MKKSVVLLLMAITITSYSMKKTKKKRDPVKKEQPDKKSEGEIIFVVRTPQKPEIIFVISADGTVEYENKKYKNEQF